MRHKIRYQAKTDLKLLRQMSGMSKEYVADKIGYTIRSLERMEQENAVTTEITARQLCSLYDLDFGRQFYLINKNEMEVIAECFAKNGREPENIIYDNREYYLLYVRKVSLFEDYIAGKVMWIGNYNRNKERRKIRKVNAKIVKEIEPAIKIINSGEEWNYWYYGLTIGKLHKVIISEKCMKNNLSTCLDEVIVTQDELFSYDGTNDIAFLGIKKRKRIFGGE